MTSTPRIAAARVELERREHEDQVARAQRNLTFLRKHGHRLSPDLRKHILAIVDDGLTGKHEKRIETATIGGSIHHMETRNE